MTNYLNASIPIVMNTWNFTQATQKGNKNNNKHKIKPVN
jgi:hypothetical protein